MYHTESGNTVVRISKKEVDLVMGIHQDWPLSTKPGELIKRNHIVVPAQPPELKKLTKGGVDVWEKHPSRTRYTHLPESATSKGKKDKKKKEGDAEKEKDKEKTKKKRGYGLADSDDDEPASRLQASRSPQRPQQQNRGGGGEVEVKRLSLEFDLQDVGKNSNVDAKEPSGISRGCLHCI